MPINKGESKMSTIQEVIPMKGSEEGLSMLIDSWRNQIKHDQQYREFTQNSIESCQRVQKKDPLFQGIIKWDSVLYKDVPKLRIIDNAEGMTPEEILNNLNSLGGSSRNNQYYNHGCGAKIAGLAWNRAGLIYQSWKNGQGFMVKFIRNEMGRYGALKLNGRYSFPISNDDKPSIIDKHGCVVILLGDSDDHDTTLPPQNQYGLLKGSRNASSEWLTAYLNTKFYTIPKNIKISVSRFVSNAKTGITNSVRGHEHGLKLDFEKEAEVQLTQTKVKIFYRQEKDEKSKQTYMTLGQLAIMNQDEVVKLEFAGKNGANPLPAWGLQMVRRHVALVLIPEGVFKQNIERTDLNYNGKPISEQLTLWKNEFKEKMPQWLKDIEAKKQQEQLDKDNDNEERLKKLAPLFKKERYTNSKKGTDDIEKTVKRKAARKRGEDPVDPPPPIPPIPPYVEAEDEFGKIEAIFGVKVDKGKYKGRKIKLINEYPELFKTHQGLLPTVGSFVSDSYSLEINIECDLIVELVNYIHKKFPKLMRDNICQEVFNLVGLSLQQQVAHLYNKTGSTEEELRVALSDLNLTACAANKDYVIDRLTSKFRKYNNWKNSKSLSVN